MSHGPDFVRPEQHEFTPDLFPSQGPGVLSGEQDVSPESGSGSGPNSVSDSEPGSAQTHQRVHHPPHTAVSGKLNKINVTPHTLTVIYLYTYICKWTAVL